MTAYGASTHKRSTQAARGTGKPSVATLSVGRSVAMTEQGAWRWTLHGWMCHAEGFAATDWAALRSGRAEARARRLHVHRVEVAA